MTVTAYIALGSNLGDRKSHLDRALDALRQQPGVQVTKVSTYIETVPVGGPPGQGMYLNAAAELHTDLEPRPLMQRLLKIEAQLGRVRGVKDAPRTIDLDLLVYGDQTIEEPDLSVPHPRMCERLFVLEPLAELAPDLVLPGEAMTIEHITGHVQLHRDMTAIRHDSDLFNRRYISTQEALSRNPHPRKRRHLEQVLKTLEKERVGLDSRIEAVRAKHDHLHRDGPCHKPI